MSRILAAGENPRSVITQLAVITLLNPDETRHLGIMYKREKQWRFLHLAHHLDLSDDEDPPNCPCVWSNPEPGLEAVQVEIVAAFCRLVADENLDAGLPYAFSSPQNWFDPRTGRVVPGSSKTGLTCASFVMAVFSSIGHPLIIEKTWVYRAEDRLFQETCLERLEKRAAREHVEAARKDLPAFRFRPEEVGGAAACDTIPADFASAVKMSKDVLDRLSGT